MSFWRNRYVHTWGRCHFRDKIESAWTCCVDIEHTKNSVNMKLLSSRLGSNLYPDVFYNSHDFLKNGCNESEKSQCLSVGVFTSISYWYLDIFCWTEYSGGANHVNCDKCEEKYVQEVLHNTPCKNSCAFCTMALTPIKERCNHCYTENDVYRIQKPPFLCLVLKRPERFSLSKSFM